MRMCHGIRSSLLAIGLSALCTGFPQLGRPLGEAVAQESRAASLDPCCDSSRTNIPRLGHALDAAALERIRGGFESADSGLKFSFSFDRVVYINGQLVAATALSLNDLQLTAGGSAGPLLPPPDIANGPAVIQNGAGNTYVAQAGASAPGTIIQNSLNNQQINTVTTIGAVVNSAQMLRAIDLQSTIRDSVIGSLRR